MDAIQNPHASFLLCELSHFNELYLESLNDEAHGGELATAVADQLVVEAGREHLGEITLWLFIYSSF